MFNFNQLDRSFLISHTYRMCFRSIYFLLVLTLVVHYRPLPALAEEMQCDGDLKILTNKVHISKAGESIKLRDAELFQMVILDTNDREIVRVWPWNSIQSKVLINSQEAKKRNLVVATNGINRISLAINSTSSSSRNSLICEIEDSL